MPQRGEGAPENFKGDLGDTPPPFPLTPCGYDTDFVITELLLYVTVRYTPILYLLEFESIQHKTF